MNNTDTAKYTAESIADSLVEAINDVWRRFSDRASTRINDICTTMTSNGVPDDLVEEYRKSFGSAYEARLDATYGKPSHMALIPARTH